MSTQENNKMADLAWTADIAGKYSEGTMGKFVPIEPHGIKEKALKSDELGPHIICGGRGMGKTTLLMYRLRILKDFPKYKAVRSVPPFGFNLPPGTIHIPKKSLLKYSSESSWLSLWRVILMGLFASSIHQRTTSLPLIDNDAKWLSVFKIEKDDYLYREILEILKTWLRSPHDECIDRLASLIMAQSPENESLDRIYFKLLDVCGERNKNSKNLSDPNIWIFYVDGIDEALSDHQGMGSILKKECYADYVANHDDGVNEENVAFLAQKLWVSAQVGFAHAAIEISRRTSKQLVAFGSIRSETYSDFQKYISHPPSKLENMVIHLKYNSSLMREIFDYNVNLMEKSERIYNNDRKGKETSSERLCGYKTISNRAVFGYSEDVYQQIARHGFDTPRSLVWTGSKVADIPITEVVWGDSERTRKWRDPSQVTSVINNHAIAIYQEYVESLFPLWDKRYEEAYKYINKNILTPSEVSLIQEKFSEIHPKVKKPVFQYLYENSLVGMPLIGEKEKLIQIFQSSEEDKEIPENFEYLLVHPALSAKIRTGKAGAAQRNFYDKRVLISPGEKFPEILPDILLHIHFIEGDYGYDIKVFESDSGSILVDNLKSSVGQLFLTVLLISIRYFQQQKIGISEFLRTSRRLLKMKVLPDKTGRADKSGKGRVALEEYIENIFDYTSRGDAASQSSAVTEGKKIIRDNTSQSMKVSQENTNNEIYFSVVFTDTGIKVPWQSIDISNITTQEFRVL